MGPKYREDLLVSARPAITSATGDVSELLEKSSPEARRPCCPMDRQAIGLKILKAVKIMVRKRPFPRVDALVENMPTFAVPGQNAFSIALLSGKPTNL